MPSHRRPVGGIHDSERTTVSVIGIKTNRRTGQPLVELYREGLTGTTVTYKGLEHDTLTAIGIHLRCHSTDGRGTFTT